MLFLDPLTWRKSATPAPRKLHPLLPYLGASQIHCNQKTHQMGQCHPQCTSYIAHEPASMAAWAEGLCTYDPPSSIILLIEIKTIHRPFLTMTSKLQHTQHSFIPDTIAIPNCGIREHITHAVGLGFVIIVMANATNFVAVFLQKTTKNKCAWSLPSTYSW